MTPLEWALRVLNGFDIDLATDATRLASRLRDALTSISPALERAVGDRLRQAGVRDLLAKYQALTALKWLLGAIDRVLGLHFVCERIDRDKLCCAGVIVTVDEVNHPDRVSIPTGKAERGSRGKAAVCRAKTLRAA